LSSSARILETGCGCGLNLLWFRQHGFRDLAGLDIDPTAISAARELFERAAGAATLSVDDALSPKSLAAERFDAILALNWTYHVEQFDLLRFIQVYHRYLACRGYLVIDVIDAAYNMTPNNQFLTSDSEKAEQLRRPSEYKNRYSETEVREATRQCGLRIIRSEACGDNAIVPRRVYILARCA